MKRRPLWRKGTALLLTMAASAAFVGVRRPARAQDTNTAPSRSTPGSPAFGETDAVRVLSDVRQGMEADNPRRFLKPFDAKKMPGFAAFRDQIAEFFQKYSPIRMNYRVTQVTTEGEFGSAAVEIALDASARQGATSNLRTTVAVRVVFAWDGKTWKIVDWSPREMFR